AAQAAAAQVAAAQAAAAQVASTETPPAGCAITRTGEYPRAAAEAVGLDPAAVRAAMDYWVAEGAENLKVFRHGCLVAEGALDAATDRIPRQNWSQTKTVSALIAGVAVRQGLISVDAPIGRYLPDGVGDAHHRAITVRSLLTMTSGLELNWFRGLALSADVAGPRQAMAMPLRHRQGEYFEYEQTTPSVLNWVVQHALRGAGRDEDYQEFAQREFFDKLGIPLSAYWWQRDRSGTTMGHAGLLLRPLEFGRLGELMRGQGVFAGERLIDRSYLRMLHTGTSANCGYGFLVWLNSCRSGQSQVNASIMIRRVISPARPWIASAPADMYYSWGSHGQHVFVIPSLDLVITRSGEQAPDSHSNAERLDTDLFFGGMQKGGYFEFFRLLMSGVADMPAAVRASLTADYREPAETLDPVGLLGPMQNEPAQAAVDCASAGCDESPAASADSRGGPFRTLPGILGDEERPPG
ncbi:serine hydrolase, partial [Sporichthya sp.]|uniref:serine hydrolase domain-containing protein n=1 Tax=Sporichthya sp. TaxID=65475 RepID=UPI0017E744CF